MPTTFNPQPIARLRPRARLAAIGVLLSSALLILPWAEPVSARGIVSVERDLDNAHERLIRDYWTARRLRKAEPLAPSPARSAGGRSKRARKPGYLTPLAPGAEGRPRWRSGKPGAESPTANAEAFESGPVAAFDVPPNTTAGKVYGRLPGFGKFECSATAVAAPNRSLVLTAGHCLGTRENGLANRIVFIPAYNYEKRPFGTWVGRELFIPKRWLRHENFNYDIGAMVVGRRRGDALGELVGGRGFAYNQPRQQVFTAVGYPANHDEAQRMWYCRSPFQSSDTTEDRGPAPLAIGCDMGLGASGGGWLIGEEYVNSLSSYFYRQAGDLLYGPYFGNRAQKLVAEAGGA